MLNVQKSPAPRDTGQSFVCEKPAPGAAGMLPTPIRSGCCPLFTRRSLNTNVLPSTVSGKLICVVSNCGRGPDSPLPDVLPVTATPNAVVGPTGETAISFGKPVDRLIDSTCTPCPSEKKRKAPSGSAATPVGGPLTVRGEPVTSVKFPDVWSIA